MPRMARTVVAGIAHHVTQRGNRKEDVFFTAQDRRRYLELLKSYSEQHGLKILAYCLMSNHVHLVVVPKSENTLAATLKPVHLRYAQHVNWTHKLGGRLWQGRYYSCPLDDQHCLAAIRYVETNPVRAGLVKKAEEYRWSSAAVHTGQRSDPILSPFSKGESDTPGWSAWLAEKPSDEMMERLRLSTRTGRPAGSATFIERLEQTCGRILRPKPGGRPRKQKTRPRHG